MTGFYEPTLWEAMERDEIVQQASFISRRKAEEIDHGVQMAFTV